MSTPQKGLPAGYKRTHIIEALFKWLMRNSALLLCIILIGIFITLFVGALPSIQANGLKFLTGTNWDPTNNEYGSLPFLVGTIISAILALIISFPFSISLAILLGEFYRKGIISDIFKNVIELMAGVPSVIYGFAALYFLIPQIMDLETHFGYPPIGKSLLAASIVLSIMVIPYWASVAREVINLVPKDMKEAAYSLGATRWEVVRYVIIPYTRTGIVAGMLLALGRALGETMAVTMVIGNRDILPKSIFDLSNTLASVIASEFGEADSTHLSALIEAALLLFLVSIILNVLGKQIIKRLGTK